MIKLIETKTGFFLPFFLFIVTLFFNSCRKDLNRLPFQKIPVPGSAQLRDVYVYNEDTLYVCGGEDHSGLILRSTDKGSTWSLIASGFDQSINSIYFTDAHTGYAVDADIIIHKTTDGGFTWNGYYPDVYPLSVNRNLRSVKFIDDSTGYACGGKNFGSGVIYFTKNRGITWEFREFNHELRGIYFSDQMHGIACGYGVMLQTSDGGSSWNISGSEHEYFTCLKNDNEGLIWTCGFNGSIFSSSDHGYSWSARRRVSNLKAGQNRLNCIATGSGSTIVAAGPSGFICWSDDAGSSWNEAESFDQNTIYDAEFLPDGTLLCAGRDGGLYKLNLH